MRILIVAAAALLAACASASAQGDAAEEIRVVYHPGVMEYALRDSGPAHLISGSAAHPRYDFQVSREEFRQIADLLDPLRANGLPCSQPSEHSAPGHIIFRRGDEERRVEMHTICYADGARPLARNTDSAWRQMEEWGHARYVAPEIPEPAIITLQNLYWGRPTATWTIPRGGEGTYADPQRTVAFEVSTETFDRIREIFRPYEERDFHCNRVITDGPYGYIIWSSQPGQEDQRTQWDAGCVSGDASDLFERIDTAMEVLAPMRDAAGEP